MRPIYCIENIVPKDADVFKITHLHIDICGT